MNFQCWLGFLADLPHAICKNVEHLIIRCFIGFAAAASGVESCSCSPFEAIKFQRDFSPCALEICEEIEPIPAN